MIIRYRQHLPGFISGLTPSFGEAGSVTTLLSFELFERWAQTPGFKRFSQASSRKGGTMHDECLLIAEFDDGKHWVVAYVSPVDALDELPLWAGPRTRDAC